MFFLWLSILVRVAALVNLTALYGPGLSPGAEIILPGDPDWATKVQVRWSDYTSPKYIGVIKPMTESDVQHTIRVSEFNGINFLATGGGHSFSDYSGFEGISIDLGNFNSTIFDKAQTRLTIGGAVKHKQLADLLYNASQELPLGSSACAGVIGTTLGAGIGPLMGHRGLIIDALESVRLVTADGRLVTASRQDNAGLFWGIRGAGSNFGIIISATFKLWDITNMGKAMTAHFVFPASVNGRHWRVLQTLDNDMPSRLSLTTTAFFDRQINQTFINLDAIYFGPAKEGEQYLERFRKLRPLKHTVKMAPQNGIFLGSCAPGQNVNIYSVSARCTDPAALESVLNRMNTFWQQHIGYQGRLLIERHSNDAAARVHHEDTSFPWRKAISHIRIEGYMTDASIYDIVDEFERSVRDRIAETSGYPSLATYSGYARGNEGAVAWFSSRNLPRLSALKRKWDPNQLFRFNKPIPLYLGTSSCLCECVFPCIDL